MGKCYKPILYDEIKGKVGNVVFYKKNGKMVVRILSTKYKDKPRLIDKAIKDNITQDEIRQLNHRIVFGLLDWLYRKKLKPLIEPAWEKLCRHKKLGMTGRNLFTNYNSEIHYSIPVDTELISPYNIPDLSRLIITEGNIYEPPYSCVRRVNYNPSTGILKMKWETMTFKNGEPSDDAYIVAIYWKPPIINSKYKWDSIRPWATMQVWNSNSGTKRGDGSAIIKLGKRLNPNYLFPFLFFKNGVNYQRSISAKV